MHVPRKSAGFTYIGLLIAVVVLGLVLSEVGVLWRTQAQREREQELLYIGREYEAAIAAYFASGPRQYPQELEDLVEDKRFPVPKHHLRKLYKDPMTGEVDWTIIRGDLSGITGIASSSKQAPIKKDGFASGEEAFKDAETYGDWQFIYRPRFRGRRAGTAMPAAD